MHQTRIDKPLYCYLKIVGTCALAQRSIDKLLVVASQLRRYRVPHHVYALHLLFWRMFRHIVAIGVYYLRMDGTHLPYISTLHVCLHCLRHTTYEIILTQQFGQHTSQWRQSRPTVTAQQFYKLLLTHSQQKLLEIHWIHIQHIHLANGERCALVQGYAKKRTCYSHMILGCFLAKILQRGKSTLHFLYLVKNKKCG